MALTNQNTATKFELSDKLTLDEVVRALRSEVKQAGPLASSSQREYERRAAQLAHGWDMGPAGKRERYLMRAAGIWDMRRQIKAKLSEADKAQRLGTAAGRNARAKILGEATKIKMKLDAFRELPWMDFDKKAKQQASHKKRPATDAQLAKFFDAVGASEFRQAFLVAEFSGCRGEELGKGVRIEARKNAVGVPVLVFYVEGAKCDGDKKGQDLRGVSQAFPKNARPEVQKRWMELAKSVIAHKGQLIVTVDATEKQTAGQRFTQIFRHFASKAELKISAYSMRHRASAQTKAMGDAENTAIVLGHQTTETQRYYGRSHSSGDISPAQIVGVNHGAPVRGATQRDGPSLHAKEKAALNKMLKSTAPPKSRGPRL